MDWFLFEGRVELVEWGRATYTIIKLPLDVADTLKAIGARRVEGEINDIPVNLALTRAPVVDGVFLWAGRSLLERLGTRPGEPLEVRLRPASKDELDTPEDLFAALLADSLLEHWSAMTPGRRRGLIYQIETARTGATRSRRIAKLISHLMGAQESNPCILTKAQ